MLSCAYIIPVKNGGGIKKGPKVVFLFYHTFVQNPNKWDDRNEVNEVKNDN